MQALGMSIFLHRMELDAMRHLDVAVFCVHRQRMAVASFTGMLACEWMGGWVGWADGEAGGWMGWWVCVGCWACRVISVGVSMMVGQVAKKRGVCKFAGRGAPCTSQAFEEVPGLDEFTQDLDPGICEAPCA